MQITTTIEREWFRQIVSRQKKVEFRGEIPAFMNFLDERPLLDTFSAAGFVIKKGWYYTRYGLPDCLRSDGREHYGVIAEKPSHPLEESDAALGLTSGIA